MPQRHLPPHVTLTDGRRFRAETQGEDAIVDIAVLRIVPDEGAGGPGKRGGADLCLPVAQLGDSDGMEVGQFVTAIGSPGGLDNTCTIGIVSGLKRCPKVVGSKCYTVGTRRGALWIRADIANMLPMAHCLPAISVASLLCHLCTHIITQK